MSSNRCREINLDVLPKKKNGTIDWNLSVGYTLNFCYNDIYGSIHIINSHSQNETLEVSMNGEPSIHIKTKTIRNCSLGKLLKVYVDGHKFKIGQVLNGVEIIGIIEKEKNNKRLHYMVRCVKDGYTYRSSQNNIVSGYGCPVCANRVIIKGINDIATTHPHLVEYFYDINDAYTNSKSNSKIVTFKCPKCSSSKDMRINTFYSCGLGCKCSDGISYPNKFITSVLSSLQIEFEKEVEFSWSKGKRYDHYIPSLNCIIENHGIQHYRESGLLYDRTLKEEQDNDLLKEELAMENGVINYIQLDCRYSDPEYIMKSILNSKLKKILNIKECDIDWDECATFASSSVLIDVCNAWNDGMEIKHISEDFKISKETVRKYLNIGTRYLKITNYDGSYENSSCRKKKILHIETGIIYQSILEASNALNMSTSVISANANNGKKNLRLNNFKFV